MLKAGSTGLLMLLLVLSAGSRADTGALPGFSATYSVSRGAITVGSSRVALTREADGGYHYESHSWPAPWVAWFITRTQHETSSGQMDATGLRPDTYHYVRTEDERERVAHLTFHWDEGEVSNNVAGSRWRMAVPDGTLDKLSSQLAIMQALAAGKADFSFMIADGGTLKESLFSITGEVRIEVPAGTFDTVRVRRLRGGSGHETVAWCAPALRYLPVRIWRRENDIEYVSELESASDSLYATATPAVSPGISP